MTIHVLPYNRVFDAKKISLLDLVEKSELSQESRHKISQIILGDAPNTNEKRVYSNKALAEIIRQNEIKNEWNFQIPFQVTVENKGYEIATKTNGFDAVEYVKDNIVDVVLMDESMPGITGLQSPLVLVFSI